MNPKVSRRYPAILGLTLGLGLGLSLGATWFVGQWEAVRRQTQFQQQIENLATALQRSLSLVFWWCCRCIPTARFRRISPRERPRALLDAVLCREVMAEVQP